MNKPYLVQNRKMKATSKNGVASAYNFGIPAFISDSGLKTCPQAGLCAVGCYARQGAYLWPKVKAAYERRLQLTQSPDFIAVIQAEILKLKQKHSSLFIRVHDSGDFYNKDYALDWFAIADSFPEVTFYAYTKSIDLLKRLQSKCPLNFKIIFSLGGKQDASINQSEDRHSRVFESRLERGYVDASKNDLKAIGSNKKIGLLYHGAKNFNKTGWTK